MYKLPGIELNFWNFLFIGLSFIGVFFSVKLVGFAKKDRASWALGAYLLLQSMVLMEYCIYWTNYIYYVHQLYAATYLFTFLYGPILYIYFDSVFENAKPLRAYAFHFIPFLLFFFIKIPFYLSAPEIKFIHPESLPLTFYINNRIDYVEIFKLIHLTIYGFVLIKFIRAQSLVGFMRQWSNWIMVFYFLFILLNIIYWSIIALDEYSLLKDYFISLALCSSIGLLAWFGDRHKELKEGITLTDSLRFIGHQSEIGPLPQKKAELSSSGGGKFKNSKYRKSGLPPSVSRKLAEEIESLMSKEKLFKLNDLKLETLAEKLNSNRHFVSQVINQYYQTSFFNFINAKRVEEAKRLLADKKKDHLNVIEIAYEVGYNNKGTFNAVFKKRTGMTPSEYRNLIR